MKVEAVPFLYILFLVYSAYIERAGVDTPFELELYDAGSDPDQVGNDGVYARYFTR